MVDKKDQKKTNANSNDGSSDGYDIVIINFLPRVTNIF